jgi:excinuclease ABC subunit C
MDELITGDLLDFGPSALNVDEELARSTIVHGGRSAQLRIEVRRHCPRKPGVYGMVDRHGELIYVGKAKSLRARLLSYFRRRGRDRKMGRILGQTRAIAWEVSLTEFAALHRELELIRRWRPRFNVQGQPHRRRFTHVCLGHRPAPYVFLARRPPAKVIASFGPIPLGRRAREAVRRLNDCFQLRDCPQAQEMIFAEDAELFSAPRTFGCLRFEVGTCLGPCAAGCSRAAYERKVRAARDFLSGTDTTLLKDLERDMSAAATKQQFESAAAARDKLVPLRWLDEKLTTYRRLRNTFSFIYPLTDVHGREIWYLIHGGRTVSAVPAPSDREGSERVAILIETVYHRKDAWALLDCYEHHDGLLLVAAWFRKHPQERLRTIIPTEALARCGVTRTTMREPNPCRGADRGTRQSH